MFERLLRHGGLLGHQEACAHGDACRATSQGRGQAAAIVIPPRRHHRHFHRVEHLRQQDGRGHAAGVAAAFAALHRDDVRPQFNGLDRVLDRADRGHAQDARVLEALDHFFVRATAVADGAHLVAVLDGDVDDLHRAGLEHVKVQAEILVGERLGLEDGGFHLGGGHHRPSEKAEAPGVAGAGHHVGIGHPAHGRLHDGIFAAEQVAQRGVKDVAHAGFLFQTSLPQQNGQRR